MASTPVPFRTSIRFRDFKQYRNLLWVIYGALCTGLALMVGVGYFVMQELPEPTAETAAKIDRDTLRMAAIVTSVVAVGFATTLPILATRKIDQQHIEMRMKSSLFAVILFAAALEAGGLLWCVIGLLVREPLYLLGSVGAAVLMLAAFPVSSRLEWLIGSSAEQIDRRLATNGVNP